VRFRVAIALALATGAVVAPGAGAANPQIAGLQVALRAQGLYCAAIDAIAGPQTVAAMRAFQRAHGLPPTGRADVRTRVALGPLGRPLFGSRTLHPRDFGLDVSVLQFLLRRRGVYHGALDGYLGPQTAAALRRYQHALRLQADAVLGPRTLSAIVARDRVPVRARVRVVTVASSTYVVRAGDNLTALARRFGTTLGALARANRLDPARPLPIGKRLRLPAASNSLLLGRSAAPEPNAAGVRATLDAWSARLGVSSRLVRALAWMESGYQTGLVSSAGARGVLQTLPSTRRFVEDVLLGHTVPDTVDGDAEVGVLYLRHLLRRFEGDSRLALAAWYQGETAVRAHGLYEVTKPFVANVLALQARM
jgi:peptidoglycan hydrolase-like protein with peptidoglycan-binding domain